MLTTERAMETDFLQERVSELLRGHPRIVLNPDRRILIEEAVGNREAVVFGGL